MPRLFTFLLFSALTAAAVVAAERGAKAAVPAVLPGPVLSGARPATPAEIAMLSEILHKTADDYRRWAYTEHRVMRDEKGRLKSETVVRFDPSKPYAEQWTPIKIDGKEPTERDRTKYRRRGEKDAPPTTPGASAPEPDVRRRPSLGELIEVGKSSIASENGTHFLFEIPLLKFGNERFPPEKFLVLARVRKDGRMLENIAVRLRESFRSKLVVKVKSGEGTLSFEPVNPKYPPALVAIEGDAVASIFFVSIGGSMELKRTELKHVKPFDERFDVQIGTLKAIDF